LACSANSKAIVVGQKQPFFYDATLILADKSAKGLEVQRRRPWKELARTLAMSLV
jgi:hypothetical protein